MGKRRTARGKSAGPRCTTLKNRGLSASVFKHSAEPRHALQRRLDRSTRPVRSSTSRTGRRSRTLEQVGVDRNPGLLRHEHPDEGQELDAYIPLLPRLVWRVPHGSKIVKVGTFIGPADGHKIKAKTVTTSPRPRRMCGFMPSLSVINQVL